MGEYKGLACPECGQLQYCPCPACRESHNQKIVWIWITGNGPIACGHCGHTMTEDEWTDECYRQLEAG